MGLMSVDTIRFYFKIDHQQRALCMRFWTPKWLGGGGSLCWPWPLLHWLKAESQTVANATPCAHLLEKFCQTLLRSEASAKATRCLIQSPGRAHFPATGMRPVVTRRTQGDCIARGDAQCTQADCSGLDTAGIKASLGLQRRATGPAASRAEKPPAETSSECRSRAFY